jgi:catechol 2,3-dioxygenase-like lactoylglutathione lyase family enzyme
VSRTRGVHHIVLTVTDVAKSAEFYADVLGMELFTGDERVQCMSDGLMLLCCQRAPDPAQTLSGDRFNENRPGLDHIGFAVESRQQLEDTLAALTRRGIVTAGIEFDPDGASEYVCFRDPDHIQIEVYVMTDGF